MNKRFWTEQEDAILVQMYPDCYASEIAERLHRSISSIYGRASILGLKASHEKIVRSGRMSSNSPNVVNARFKKGHTPANKGQKMSPETYAKVSRTMFKKGNVPANHKPVGSERINIYGYIEIKVAEPNKWQLKHRVIWEQHNGTIPKGFNIQFRNHIPTDCRIENLYIISHSDQLMKENSLMAKYPKELQDIIRLRGAVNRQINKYERNNGK